MFLRSMIVSGLILLLSPCLFADLGFNRLIVNAPSRGWRVSNRNMIDKTRIDSQVVFLITGLTGTGETDDQITFEMTFKEDYVEGVGWDESKTRQYTGTGLVKTIEEGRVNFEIYVDTGNGNSATVGGYYHPGYGSSDSDDRVMLNLPNTVLPDIEEDCDPVILEEGGLGSG